MRPALRLPESRAVALVVTLMMMSVMVMMVVGLAGVMRNEQAAARNLSYRVTAEEMAAIAQREGMAEVFAASPTDGSWSATGPGWIFADRTLTPLFPVQTETGVKNLEEIGTNSLILGLATFRDGGNTNRGNLSASWKPVMNGTNPLPVGRYTWWVDDEGVKLNLNLVASNSTNLFPLLNPFPFSADHIFVNPHTGTNLGPRSRDQATALASRRLPLPTPEHLKAQPSVNEASNSVMYFTNTNGWLTADHYRAIKGTVTTWSSSRDTAPWGADRVNLGDSNLSYATILGELRNTNRWTNLFDRDMTLARKYGGGSVISATTNRHGDLVLQQIAANVLAALGRPYTNTTYALTNRLPPPGNISILTNRFRYGIPIGVTSHYRGPYLEEVRVLVDAATNNGSNNIQARLAVQVSVINPYPEPVMLGEEYSVVYRPRKFRMKFLQGTPGTNTTNDIVSLTNVTGIPIPNFNPAATNDGWWLGPDWYVDTASGVNQVFPYPFQTNNPTYSNNVSIGPRTNQLISFISTFRFDIINNRSTRGIDPQNIYVMLDQVVLKRGANVVDWVSLDDFAQERNYRTNWTIANDYGQMKPTPRNAPTLEDPPDFSRGIGLRKVDPQTRFPLSFWTWDTNTSVTRGVLLTSGWPSTVQAWTTNLVFDATNTNTIGAVTGISYLWPDPAPGVNQIIDHPHFVPGYRPTNGIVSVAQLGAIHTGLPWRTLRLQPQPAVERGGGGVNLNNTNFPPDWILLDLFCATNPAENRARINLNSATLALVGGQPGLATNRDEQSPNRTWALMGAMGSLVGGSNFAATNTNFLATQGFPISFVTNTNNLFANTLALRAVGTNLYRALTNPQAPAGWSTNSTWAAVRALGASAGNFPSNGLILRGELVEVAGIADGTANQGEDVVEGRLRAFLDLVTTRSDTFSVWSVGQAFAYNTNRSTNPIIMGEVRRQSVFQREPQVDPATGRITGYGTRLLYTRTHLVD